MLARVLFILSVLAILGGGAWFIAAFFLPVLTIWTPLYVFIGGVVGFIASVYLHPAPETGA